MVQQVIENLKTTFQEYKKQANKTQIQLKERIRESEFSIDDDSTGRIDFEFKVLKRGIDPFTGKIPAEKFLK